MAGGVIMAWVEVYRDTNKRIERQIIDAETSLFRTIWSGSMSAEAKQKMALLKASQIATRDLIKSETVTPEEVVELTALYPAWQSGLSVIAGELYQYNDNLYEVIRHTQHNPTGHLILYRRCLNLLYQRMK